MSAFWAWLDAAPPWVLFAILGALYLAAQMALSWWGARRR